MANKIITLFDNRLGTEMMNLTPTQLRSLLKLKKTVGLSPEPSDGGQWKIRAGSLVGTLRVPDLTIQILPKIHRNEDKNTEVQAKAATRNLLYMLKYAVGLDVKEHDIAPLSKRRCDWFEILTYLFASRLLGELQRGMVRAYTPVEDDISFLKGKWLIQRQVHFPVRRHVFSVAYDEFTEDNLLNRVFRYVVDRLWRLTADPGNKLLLGNLCQMMDSVALLPKMTGHDAAKASVSRLYTQYEPILNLAKLFLDDGSLQVAAGKLNTFAFVFDMNKLFEGFVAGFIQRHRREILPDNLQSCDLQPQSKGTPFYLATNGDNCQAFHVKPDLVFKKSEENFPLLLDTKYKILKGKDSDLDVEPGDFYQMFAYARRYTGCERVILLYPWGDPGETPAARFVLNHGRKDDDSHRAVIEVAALDLRLDLSEAKGRECLRTQLNKILRGKNDEHD